MSTKMSSLSIQLCFTLVCLIVNSKRVQHKRSYKILSGDNVLHVLPLAHKSFLVTDCEDFMIAIWRPGSGLKEKRCWTISWPRTSTVWHFFKLNSFTHMYYPNIKTLDIWINCVFFLVPSLVYIDLISSFC